MAEGTNIFKRLYHSFTGKAEAYHPRYNRMQNITLVNSVSLDWTGEKNLGEMGAPKEYRLDYDSLRVRSWQAYHESEIAKIVVDRVLMWVVGNGLKLQATPNKEALKTENITVDSEHFNKVVESRWHAWADSKMCSYNKQMTFAELEFEAMKMALIGGDVLIINRYDNRTKQCSVDVIDGACLGNLLWGDDEWAQELENGNQIRCGVEYDRKGTEVAYYVKAENSLGYDRVPAYTNVGTRQAFLYRFHKMRLDNSRGLPLISVVLETLSKLERYKEATVATAEELSKIVYQITHQAYSTGENPMKERMLQAMGVDDATGQPSITQQGEQLASRMILTTNKTTVNNPPGAEIKPLQSNNRELYFKDFYTVNIDIVCAALGIPPNVAMQKYDSNFSASRAALKDWEHSLTVLRQRFVNGYHVYVYQYWFDVQVRLGKVVAPQYIAAKSMGNYIITESYTRARWVGAQVPHIDPVKEVQAERLKLGANMASAPLTTLEAATERLNGGDSVSNMEQFADELQTAKNLGIETSGTADPRRSTREVNED